MMEIEAEKHGLNLPVLAAWLHGMGKFVQAANAMPEPGGQDCQKETPDYTAWFIEQVLPLPEELESRRADLARLAANSQGGEQMPREFLAIRKAAELSQGMNGAEAEGDFARARLDSIFSGVRLGGRGLEASAPRLQYKLEPLGEGNSVFPVSNAQAGGSYRMLWEKFVAELKQIPRNLGARVWQATLASLLERYCWCVPSAGGRSGVSLYDQSAAMAALTQAILGCEAGREKFLLFGGDLSGIQAFIFGREEPADKGATRLLRARSLILQAVTRSIWLALLDRLKMDFAAKIMDSGGRFILLLPDTQSVREHIERLSVEAEEWLCSNFQGAIRVNFATLAIAENDLGRENFFACFEQFNELLEGAKLHPFSRILASGHTPVFEKGYGNYGEFGECDYCHTRPATSRADDRGICGQCAQLQKLGSCLPSASFMVFTRKAGQGAGVFSGMLFDNLELHVCAERPSDAECRSALQILSIRDKVIFTTSPIAGYIPLVKKQDMRRWQEEGSLVQDNGTALFGGEECEPGTPKTFGMLAEESRIAPGNGSKHWESVAYLGICKADVDNLGLVFSMGFQGSFNLSRYAMLARMLNYFFSGYLMRLIREEFPNIYVVFAGGDDVFVIGPWPEIITFSQRMASDFRKFCGDNPAVTISAGLPLVRPGLPMSAMREEAEELLEQSKSYDNGSKDCLTLFGVSAHWQEAQKLLECGRWLAEMINAGIISRGFVRRLLGYSRDCREFFLGKDLAKNGLYLSHYRYDLARNYNKGQTADILRERGGEDTLLKLQNLPQDSRFFSQLEMGIAWAIYRTRISA